MHIFTLPLENPYIEQLPNGSQSVVDIPKLVKEGTEVDKEKHSERDPIIKPKTDSEEFISQRYEPTAINPCRKLISTFSMIIWHILIFIVITIGLYAGFHYGFETNEKKILLDAFSFLYDWRPLVFFLGIYMSYTVKKVSDISAVT